MSIKRKAKRVMVKYNVEERKKTLASRTRIITELYHIGEAQVDFNKKHLRFEKIPSWIIM